MGDDDLGNEPDARGSSTGQETMVLSEFTLFSHLPVELKQAIVDHVTIDVRHGHWHSTQAPDKQTLATLRICSRELHQLCDPSWHRTLDLGVMETDFLKAYRMLRHREIACHSREIGLMWFPDEVTDGNLSDVTRRLTLSELVLQDASRARALSFLVCPTTGRRSVADHWRNVLEAIPVSVRRLDFDAELVSDGHGDELSLSVLFRLPQLLPSASNITTLSLTFLETTVAAQESLEAMLDGLTGLVDLEMRSCAFLTHQWRALRLSTRLRRLAFRSCSTLDCHSLRNVLEPLQDSLEELLVSYADDRSYSHFSSSTSLPMRKLRQIELEDSCGAIPQHLGLHNATTALERFHCSSVLSSKDRRGGAGNGSPDEYNILAASLVGILEKQAHLTDV